jgi:20S proteasome alpha/beta subunit
VGQPENEVALPLSSRKCRRTFLAVFPFTYLAQKLVCTDAWQRIDAIMRTFDFHQEEEELNMTLQVALVGKDGFVIASDTKASAGGDSIKPFSKDYRMYRSAETRKIVVSEDKTLVCAFSGHQTVSYVSSRLIRYVNENPGVDMSQRLEVVLQDLFATLDDNVQLATKGDLIVAIPAVGGRLWDASFGGGAVCCQETFDRVIGGDFANSAIYFPQAYHSTDRSVDELTMLAAHTIIEGGLRNPMTVGGLDVLVSKNDEKPRFLEETELQLLWDRSEDIHNALATAIFADHRATGNAGGSGTILQESDR